MQCSPKTERGLAIVGGKAYAAYSYASLMVGVGATFRNIYDVNVNCDSDTCIFLVRFCHRAFAGFPRRPYRGL